MTVDNSYESTTTVDKRNPIQRHHCRSVYTQECLHEEQKPDNDSRRAARCDRPNVNGDCVGDLARSLGPQAVGSTKLEITGETNKTEVDNGTD
jgi:hypothetical protein